MRAQKKDDMVRWIELSKEPNEKQCKAWMQICHDYSTDYEYNWHVDFLESEGDGIGTKFDVSILEEDDIFKVSGGTQEESNHLYGKVLDNSDDGWLEYQNIGKDEAIEELREVEDDLREMVLNQVKNASMDELEFIHAKLNDK